MAVIGSRPMGQGRGFGRAAALWAGVVCGAATTAPIPSLGQSPPAPKEYQLKAVFLFNFAQFVEWPATAFPEPDSPLIIGILGSDPFGSYLDETVQGELVNNHPLTVQRFLRVEDIGACHILFVSHEEKGHLEHILAGVKGRSILTVGDVPGFASQGGMIRFVNDNNRIRLRINLEAAKADDLKLSSKLLRPATIISTGED